MPRSPKWSPKRMTFFLPLMNEEPLPFEPTEWPSSSWSGAAISKACSFLFRTWIVLPVTWYQLHELLCLYSFHKLKRAQKFDWWKSKVQSQENVGRTNKASEVAIFVKVHSVGNDSNIWKCSMKFLAQNLSDTNTLQSWSNVGFLHFKIATWNRMKILQERVTWAKAIKVLQSRKYRHPRRRAITSPLQWCPQDQPKKSKEEHPRPVLKFKIPKATSKRIISLRVLSEAFVRS